MNKKNITIIGIVLIIFILLINYFIIFISNPIEIYLGDFFIEFERNFIQFFSGIIVLFLIIIILIINFKGKIKQKNRNASINSNQINSQNQKNTNNQNNMKNNITDEVNKKNLNNEKNTFTSQASIEQKRESLNQELKIAENQFLKNKIDKNTFDKISKEKNAELISIEAQIDSKKKIQLSEEEIQKLNLISEDKKNILKGLLEQKQKKIYELQIAEKSYYKRKIDASTFQKINVDIKSEIISLEGNIKSIQKVDQIEKIKNELKKGAEQILIQQKKSDKRKNENEIFEADVFDQIDKMVGGLKN
ncbi:MAG: hypothetical protein PHX27_03660 [Candidatus ainarchaeum sp.]|nr:hypothetical protein [Candidatus ainarchaeum sp.]